MAGDLIGAIHMKRTCNKSHEEIINYYFRGNGLPVVVFANTQPKRVEIAQRLVRNALGDRSSRAIIWELGCSAGDITGVFSDNHSVTGVDMVPEAIRLTQQRYPKVNTILAKAEDVEPISCDVLVLCEFLEHIADPAGLISAWMPLAENVIIGHPLNEPIPPLEPGHVWSYNRQDYLNWFEIGHHRLIETHTFSEAYPEMVIGRGLRLEVNL